MGELLRLQRVYAVMVSLPLRRDCGMCIEIEIDIIVWMMEGRIVCFVPWKEAIFSAKSLPSVIHYVIQKIDSYSCL